MAKRSRRSPRRRFSLAGLGEAITDNGILIVALAAGAWWLYRKAPAAPAQAQAAARTVALPGNVATVQVPTATVTKELPPARGAPAVTAEPANDTEDPIAPSEYTGAKLNPWLT